MGVYRITIGLTGHTGSPPSANVFHFRTVADGDDPLAQEQRNSAVSALHDFYESIIGVLGLGVTAVFPDFVLVPGAEESAPINDLPNLTSAASGQAPSVLAYCINWTTSSRSRRGRGRTFIGPLQFGAINTDGNPDSSPLNTLTAACDALLVANALDNGWSFGVWGQQNPGQAEPKVLRDWTGYSVARDQFSIMTSRRDRG